MQNCSKIILFIYLLLLGCKEPKEVVQITVTDITIIYSKPKTVSYRIATPLIGKYKFAKDTVFDQVKSFNSSVFLKLAVKIKNNCNQNIDIELNDLGIHRYSFDLVLLNELKNAHCFNYPFSQSGLPHLNRFRLKPLRQEVLDLETPIYLYSRSFNEKILDSLKLKIRNSHFKLESSNPNLKFIVDTLNFNVHSVANANFNYPIAGSSL